MKNSKYIHFLIHIMSSSVSLAFKEGDKGIVSTSRFFSSISILHPFIVKWMTLLRLTRGSMSPSSLENRV